MKKILFLDIDHVLNDGSFNTVSQSFTLKKDCVTRFNRIIHATKPLCVISSAWRYCILSGAMTLEGFKIMMRTHGITDALNLIGYCGLDLEENLSARGLVIDRWLKSNGIIGQLPFLIIDDAPKGMDFSPHWDKLYQTSSEGLLESDVEGVINRMRSL